MDKKNNELTNSNGIIIPNGLPDNGNNYLQDISCKPAWKIFINGIESSIDIKSLKIHNPRFGAIEYGLCPSGWDTCAIIENGGGGSILIPYCLGQNMELYLGLVLEQRDNMGGYNWCCVGGFKKEQETHNEAILRENLEETGIHFFEIFRLGRFNPNRAWFVTSRQDDCGVKTYGMQIPRNYLKSDDEGLCLSLDIEKKFLTKKDSKLRFFPWAEALSLTDDGFINNAFAHLLLWLKKHNINIKLF